MLVGVRHNEVENVWDAVKDRIEYTLFHYGNDVTTANDLHDLIMNRDAQLWTTSDLDAVMVTQILIKPDIKECLIWVFNADTLTDKHWLMFDDITDWAKHQGCDLLRAITRPGFEKILSKRNWKKRHVVMTRRLD